MSTITIEFTKEQLIAKAREQIAFCCHTKITGESRTHVNQCSALFEIALASLEVEPIGAFHIADQRVDGTSDYIKDGEWPIDDGVIEVYASPPAPLVPDGYTAAADTGIPIESVGWQLVPAVQDDGRKQFEEWFKFHYGEDGSIMKLHRANGGANYRDPYVDLAWIAWKESRVTMYRGEADSVRERKDALQHCLEEK